MAWSEKMAKARACLPVDLDGAKEIGVNCNPSTCLEAAAGVTISTLVKSHALASLYGTVLSLLLQLHNSFSLSHWLAEHIMAGAYHAFHSCSASSCCPQHRRAALVCAFCGILVTPGLTRRRVPAPLLSLRKDEHLATALWASQLPLGKQPVHRGF